MERINYLANNGIPRRNRIDLATPVEQRIREAREAVEVVGCDVRLTEASILIGKALDLVADWCEETGTVMPETTMQ